MQEYQVKKPPRYSKLKKKIIKEIFIFRRKLKDVFFLKKLSKEKSTEELQFKIFEHKSFLLRPLKDVEMYLQHNKITNLKIAFSTFSGIIIKPGETFSVWKNVGRPTQKKGYLDGLILTNGKIGKGVGGGLCQLGNLLYWLILHSPLDITERWRHSYDVFPDVNRKLPFGSGATLSYNYVDFRVTNNTKQTFQLILWTSDEYLHAKLLSDKQVLDKYEIFETDHRMVKQYWGGYTRHNKIWKKTISPDGEEKTELVADNYAVMMYEPMLEAHK